VNCKSKEFHLPKDPIPFVLPKDRQRITREPDRVGKPSPEFPDVDWIGFGTQGSGRVPPDFRWNSNPKEKQERESAG
jgi:hypothetical protein